MKASFTCMLVFSAFLLHFERDFRFMVKFRFKFMSQIFCRKIQDLPSFLGTSLT